MNKRGLSTILVVLALFLGTRAEATSIYVIDAGVSGHGMVIAAKNNLNALGYTVSNGGTLGSYLGFDEVWDLRYQGNLLASDIASMGAYLNAGGRMYLTGEHSGFDATRNVSLVNFLSAVGAGALTLNQAAFVGTETFTAAGAIVNSPNNFGSLAYSAARTTTSAGNGFLVTQTAFGDGSLVGWNFGNIVGSANARMLVGFDIEIFQNGQNWTQDMATYLGAGAVAQPVPEPASLLLFGTGLVAIGRRQFQRRRRS